MVKIKNHAYVLGTFPLNVSNNPTQKHNSCVLHRSCRKVRRLRMCEMHLLAYLQQPERQRPQLNRNKQSLCAQHIQTPQAQPLPRGPNRIYRHDFFFLSKQLTAKLVLQPVSLVISITQSPKGSDFMDWVQCSEK